VDSIFTCQIKRLHEVRGQPDPIQALTGMQYKRQTLNLFGIIHRYLRIKKATPQERKKIAKHTAIFAGKAAPGKLSTHLSAADNQGYYIAKLVIRLIVNVAKIVVSAGVTAGR
jgi:starch phosphorylase